MATQLTPSAPTAARPPQDPVLRPLKLEDVAAVTALDRRVFGASRKGYFEKRAQAALRKPKRHLQLALTTPEGLVGFLLARIAGGEYGRAEDVVVLEAVGVAPDAQHAGLGKKLLAGLDELMKARGLHLLTTQVDWRNHSMLRFLDGAGFQLAPRQLLQRPVDRIPLPQEDAAIEARPPVVRPLEAGDLAALMRIDRRLGGIERMEYFQRKFDEALNESAIQVSLVALNEGLPVAFAMARVDFGDFGHLEPVSALETVGVDPDFKGKGYAQAVLNQMVENLAALHVEWLETEVARESLELLRFLYTYGFEPSPRLCFTRQR
jgi:ribosomal protein S18 acetylase RimI-like enzyme